MFEKGARILVLASTRRKGAGPRKGSIGYVSTSITSEYFSDYVANIHEVFFTRYGFEESTRLERKPVISVFPVIKEGEDVPTQVKSLIRRVISPKNDKDWNSVRAAFDVVAGVPVVVVVPDNINKVNLVNTSDTEFKAWAHSLLYNQWFLHKSHETLMRGHFKNSKEELISEANLNKLREMSNDKDFRTVALSDITSGAAGKEKFITLMRLFMSLFGVKDHNAEMKAIISSIAAMLGQDKEAVKQQTYYALSGSLFRPTACLIARESANISGNKDLIHIVDSIEQTRNELLRLSSRLEASE